MGIFAVLLLVPMLLQMFKPKHFRINYSQKNKWAITFFFVLLTIMLMFRHPNVGVDTKNYISIFKKHASTSWEALNRNPQELGYSYLNKLISFFSKEPQFFLAVVAIIMSSMIYPTYKRLCTDASLTIVLFCTMSTFIMMFSGVRQMLAVSMGFIAYECTRKKKLIFFIPIVLLAMTFHISAFMLVFIYPLYHANITKKWLIAIVPTLGIIFLFNRQIFSFMSALLLQRTGYGGEIIATGAYSMLLLFAAFALFSFIIPDEKALDKETLGLRNMLLMALALQMFAPLHNLAMRLNYYYIIFIPLLIPKVIAYKRPAFSQIATWGRHIMVLFFLAYFFLNAYTGSNLRVFPYHFFWEVT